jgi:hypothetical protein
MCLMLQVAGPLYLSVWEVYPARHFFTRFAQHGVRTFGDVLDTRNKRLITCI